MIESREMQARRKSKKKKSRYHTSVFLAIDVKGKKSLSKQICRNKHGIIPRPAMCVLRFHSFYKPGTCCAARPGHREGQKRHLPQADIISTEYGNQAICTRGVFRALIIRP